MVLPLGCFCVYRLFSYKELVRIKSPKFYSKPSADEGVSSIRMTKGREDGEVESLSVGHLSG